jgi:hypothetical protein
MHTRDICAFVLSNGVQSVKLLFPPLQILTSEAVVS